MNIPIGPRLISHPSTLGVGQHTFNLVQDEIIHVVKPLPFGNSLVDIRGTQLKLYNTTIDFISNFIHEGNLPPVEQQMLNKEKLLFTQRTVDRK